MKAHDSGTEHFMILQY